MVTVTPNLHFNGCCEEAMSLYKKTFGSDGGFMLRWSESDPKDFSEPLTNDQKNYIYHAEMYIGNQRIMMSDKLVPDDCDNVNDSFLTVTFESAGEVNAAFDTMKENCVIIHPPRRTTYSSRTVNFIDRFGKRWTFMTEQTEK